MKLTTGLGKKIGKGTEIIGVNNKGTEVVGKSYAAFDKGATTIQIQYQTTDTQNNYVNCQVGALPLTGTEIENTKGCFAELGNLQINGDTYGYTYTQLEDNNNGRAIDGFSTSAQSKMYEDCPGCPYTDFTYFYDYYGAYDYANQWVLAALDGTTTNFRNGNADFNDFGLVGREEAVKKGTAYMNVFMYVLREFEDALDDCKENCIACNDDPVHAWDEGVAFYTGSLEGQDGAGEGNLLYSLADKRCANYKTCGAEGNSLQGTAKNNYDLFDLFTVGQHQLLMGNCISARETKNRIADLMYAPLIQGAIRYAYKVDKLQGEEKEKAEGATFAAAVLPRIHAISPEAADTIYTNMKVGASSTSFEAVKSAFESTYADIGITCAHVGGLWNEATSGYYEGMSPCVDASTTAAQSKNVVGIVVGSLFAVIAVAAVGGVCYMRKRELQGKPVFDAVSVEGTSHMN